MPIAEVGTNIIAATVTIASATSTFVGAPDGSEPDLVIQGVAAGCASAAGVSSRRADRYGSVGELGRTVFGMGVAPL
jgi:hypothetical protein